MIAGKARHTRTSPENRRSRAIAPFGAGFVAVGERGALVAVATRDERITRDRDGDRTFASEDLTSAQTRAKFICATGELVHLASHDVIGRAASARVDANTGALRDVWLDNGIVRVVTTSAAVLEAAVTAVP